MDTQLEAHIVASVIAGLILLIDAFVRVGLLFYIPRNRKPTAALAWLFAIVITPIIGTIVFLIIGSTKLSRRRREMQSQIDRMYHRYNQRIRDDRLDGHVAAEYQSSAQLAESLGSLAPTRHNSVAIINGYETIIEQITASVHDAKEYIYVEFFALALDTTTEPFFKALEKAVTRGVAVYVLFDTLGSRKYPRYREMQRRLTHIGAKWHKVLPIRFNLRHYNRPDLRNHRKIVVVDNQHAYLGSLNMIDKTYHRKDAIHYVELVAHIQGPSVNESAAVFASDWYSETEQILHHFLENAAIHTNGSKTVQILPSGPGYHYRNNLKVFVDLIHSAKASVIITNPYLVPDESLLSALLTARLRGVSVSILNSEAMDQWMVGHAQRSYYEELLEAGIAISLYEAPLLVHSKYMTIDQQVAIIGSSNLDIRSFELNLESSVIVYDEDTARTLHQQHHKDLRHAQRLTLAQWRRRSKWSQFLDSVARLTSAVQ
jgi:cardiolipin synthase A/B